MPTKQVRTTARSGATLRTAGTPGNTSPETDAPATPAERTPKQDLATTMSRRAYRLRKKATVKKKTVAFLKLKAKTRPRKMQGGPPSARQASADMKRLTDRHRALDLKVKGATYRQIGDALGISHVTAREYVFSAAADVVMEDAKLVATMRAIEGERCDEVHRAMTPLLHGQVPERTTRVVEPGAPGADGTPGKPVARVVPVPNDPVDVARVQAMAASRIVTTAARRAALFGLDAPIKIAPVDPSGLRRYHDLPEDELAKMIAQKQRALGSSVIDAQVVTGRREET